jgi:hypothetical protein
LKKFAKNIKKLYKTFDVSPFGSSGIKIIIFLIWGLNALVFLSTESIAESSISTEQLSIVSREFFDYFSLPDEAISINIDIEPYLAGIVIDSDFTIPNSVEQTYNSDRAPPEIS